MMAHDEIKVPEDIDAERSIVSTIYGNPDHPELDEVFHILPASYFMFPAYRAIYEAMGRLYVDHQDIDALSIKADCERHGTLAKVNGYSGVIETMREQEVLHPLVLVNRIQEMADRRRLMRLGSDLLKQAGDVTQPVTDTVANLLDGAQGLDVTPLRSRLTLVTPDEFLDDPIPDHRWLIPGLIPLGVPTVLASKGGIGKSFLSLQMCIALATGKPFLSFDALPPMGAVYFGLEDDRDTFHRRLRSIVDHYRECGDWTDEDDFNLRHNLSVPFVNWQLRDATAYLPTLAPDLESILKKMTQQGVNPGVIVIDTLSRVSEGDENTMQALRPILNACNALSSYGYTPLMLHHVGKGQDGARSSDSKKPLLSERMSPDWVRGTSGIVDNFRCVLQFAPILESEAEGAGLDPEKARMGGYLVFGATKLNGGQKADWIFLEQDEHGRWFAPADGVETLAKLRGGKAIVALSKQMELLAGIYQSTQLTDDIDTHALALKFAPPESKNPQVWFRVNVGRLRNSGFIRKNSYLLTVAGVTACFSKK